MVRLSAHGAKPNDTPLVSVVIPCYNHGRFLGSAIDSVLAQTYQNVEVVVVNDGSTDETEAVAGKYPGTVYIRQENSGLSAARNTGLAASKGSYVVFLDADDLLLPGALQTNMSYFKDNAPYAFVAGAHYKINRKGEKIPATPTLPLQKDPYRTFLKGNFIGMHAAVMYKKKLLLQSGGFDTTLSACEDYELYLRLSSSYPVYHHGQAVAIYRIHGENMSADIPFMLKHVLEVLRMQLPLAKKKGLLADYRTGIKVWTDYYMTTYVAQLRQDYGSLKRVPLPKWRAVLRYGKLWALKKKFH